MKRTQRHQHPLVVKRTGVRRRTLLLVRPVLAGCALGLLALGTTAIIEGPAASGPGTNTPPNGSRPDVVLPVIDESHLAGLSEAAQVIVRDTEACEAVVLQEEPDLDAAQARIRTECHEPAADRMAELNAGATPTTTP